MPCVIFVTAYDQYAVRAFDVLALDYLLKPFDRERFEKASSRAKKQILSQQDGNIGESILRALEEIKTRPVYLERLVIKTSGHIFFLKTDEVDYFEAEGNYVRLHAGKESYLLRDTISAIESQVDPKSPPHSPLYDRKHRPDTGATTLVPRRIPYHLKRRRGADAFAHLPRKTARAVGQADLISFKRAAARHRFRPLRPTLRCYNPKSFSSSRSLKYPYCHSGSGLC